MRWEEGVVGFCFVFGRSQLFQSVFFRYWILLCSTWGSLNILSLIVWFIQTHRFTEVFSENHTTYFSWFSGHLAGNIGMKQQVSECHTYYVFFLMLPICSRCHSFRILSKKSFGQLSLENLMLGLLCPLVGFYSTVTHWSPAWEDFHYFWNILWTWFSIAKWLWRFISFCLFSRDVGKCVVTIRSEGILQAFLVEKHNAPVLGKQW